MRACAVGLAVLLGAGSAAMANLAASSVVSYEPGSPAPAQNKRDSALGLPAGDTGWGALTPFNSAWSPEHIVVIRPNGSLVLKFEQPVLVGSSTKLGVYSNNGLTLSPTPEFDLDYVLYNTPNRAYLSISADGINWLTRSANGWSTQASALVSFENPANAYTDNSVEELSDGYYYASPGAEQSDYYKPFAGTLSDFDGKNYKQMLTLLNGSAGGDWFDLSGSGLESVQYVKFVVPEVPEGASGYHMVVDSVVVTPEPATLGVLVVAGLALMHRRRRAC